MGPTRRHLQDELDLLQRQRERYIEAANLGTNRAVVLRHLLNAERLEQEIEALRSALEALLPADEDITMPIWHEETLVYDLRAFPDTQRCA